MWHLSKIAKRLAIYFGSVLVLFAIVLGVVFYQQYKTQAISLKEEEMKATSLRMAEVVAGFHPIRFAGGALGLSGAQQKVRRP